MITSDLRAEYNHTKWGIAARGLFGILIGIIILSRPIASVAALALIIALWALVEGIVAITYAFELRSIVQHWWALLITGLVSVLFGIAALYYYPGLSLAFVVLWVAWWLITAGLMSGYLGYAERRIGLSWGWTLVWAVLAVAAGVLSLIYPGITLAWVLGLLAAFGIIGGIVRLIIAFRMQSFQGNARERGALRVERHA